MRKKRRQWGKMKNVEITQRWTRRKRRASGNLFHITHTEHQTVYSFTWRFIKYLKWESEICHVEWRSARRTRWESIVIEQRELDFITSTSTTLWHMMRPLSTWRDIHILRRWQIDSIKHLQFSFIVKTLSSPMHAWMLPTLRGLSRIYTIEYLRVYLLKDEWNGNNSR